MEKYIHYCWFGRGKLPKLAKKCIKSWKKYLPEYKIIEWNEDNFDVNITEFSKKAYEAKKWAFVSDVARVCALKEMGGIYFDTDMMITKKIDKSILESKFFVGWESNINIAVGVLGAEKGNKIIERLYNIYKKTEFDPNDLFRITIPRLLTDILKKNYSMKNLWMENQILENDTRIYARDYFYPISSDTSIPDSFTDNTCMIHYYHGSWLSRDMQLKMKYRQIFGKKLGDIILKILVLGKHTLIKLKNILKRILIIILYPVVKIRRKKYQEYLISVKKERIDKAIEEIKSDSVIFCHQDWIGVKNATKELFGDKTIEITELYDEEVIDYFAKKLVERNVKLIAFSGFANGWDKTIKKIKELDEKIKIKVIWHGSMCMNIYDYDYIMFTSMFELLKKGTISNIVFVKKSMYDFFKKKGFPVQFLANNVTVSNELKDKIEHIRNNTSSEDNKKTKIGLYASGDRWVKNFYNQMAAASMIENSILDCIPINYKAYELAKILNSNIKGLSTTISHEKLLERMSQNDINLYVTFSECAPIIPLESLELGVPCITGNNHHYFEGTKLQEYLVVDKPDDLNAIYEGIIKCLEHKDEILEEYKKWKEKNNLEVEKTKKEFFEQ